ncbi:MAG TPA: phosphatase PAP2 family protein [Caproicibacter sp.]|nr:phosphatase PAP2 family protein [Caproicibacter sp.]
MDVTILNYVQDHFHNKITDFIFTLLSRIGNAGAVWMCFAIYLGIQKSTRRYALMLFFSIALAHLISQILKPLIGRPRPFMAYPGKQLLIHTPGGYSCPSGHSASSFAAATSLLIANSSLGIVALILAFSIAFSRIFLFVHYPSDTLVGSILGVLSALLIFNLYRM